MGRVISVCGYTKDLEVTGRVNFAPACGRGVRTK